MSHFTVAVVTKDKNKLEEILAPYSEDLKVPRYIKYTKEQLIENEKKRIEDYKNSTYAKFLKDPIEYKSNCKNEAHIKYLEEEFPKQLNWTDEQIYQNKIKYYDEEDIGENGEVYSEYNPNSKWDWYDIGGRWRNQLLTREDNNDTFEHNSFAEHMGMFKDTKEAPKGYKWVNGAKIKDIDFNKIEEVNGKPFYTWALVDENGWYEQGRMGWWAINDATDESTNNFAKQFKEYVESVENQDNYLIIVDCHI